MLRLFKDTQLCLRGHGILGSSCSTHSMPAGEIAVLLPEKLPTNKYIVELEPTGDGADDLTGDAGAVGRMLVSGFTKHRHQQC